MTTTRWPTNVVLLLLVIGLSILTFQSNEIKKKSDTRQNLSSLRPEAVSSIRIQKKDKLVQIEKNNGVWHITKPIDVKANQFRIGSLLNLLTTDNYTRYSSSNIALEKFGLAQPSLSVIIDNTRFDFGIVNPMNSRRYVLFDNNMYLIEDLFFPLINSQLGTLVDQNLLPADIDITKIVLPDATLAKSDEGLWQSDDSISSDNIIETVGHWKNAQAFGVHDYMERERKEKVEIYFKYADATEVTKLTCLITDREPWLIIARPDLNLEYHFDKENTARLLMTAQQD